MTDLREELLHEKLAISIGSMAELICLDCEREFWASVRTGEPDVCPLCGGERVALTGEVREG